jgi:hypothetical protein
MDNASSFFVQAKPSTSFLFVAHAVAKGVQAWISPVYTLGEQPGRRHKRLQGAEQQPYAEQPYGKTVANRAEKTVT